MGNLQRLSKSHIWACDFAEKCKNRGRMKGGFIVERKRKWEMKRCELIAKKDDGLIRIEI